MSDDRYAWHIEEYRASGDIYGSITPVAATFWDDDQTTALNEVLRYMRRDLIYKYPALNHGTLILLRWRVQPPPFIQIEDDPPRNMMLIEAHFEHDLSPGE